jgi:hypothetical protein
VTQHDYNIANQTFPATRTDINNALASILGLNAGTSAPSTTAPGLLWYDTTNGLVKQRNAADSGWLTLYAIGSQGFVSQNGSSIYAADAGSNDTYAITLSPAPSSYVVGMVVHFLANTTNTGAATLNVNSLGAVTIKKAKDVDLADGDIKAGQQVSVIYDGSNWQLLSMPSTVGGNVFPKGYISGPPPLFTSSSTVTVKAGLKARDSGNAADIEVGSDIAVALSTSGAAGLDAGSEASNTWYYLYLIRKSSDGTVSAILSATNESVSGSITYPSGYNQKRQLPIAIRNDGSSNILPFYTGAGWPFRPFIGWNVAFSDALTTVGTTNIFNGTIGTSYTSPASGSAYVPTGISNVARYRMDFVPPASAGYSSLRPTGSGHEGERARYTTGSNGTLYADFSINNSAQVEAKSSGGNGSAVIDVVGFYVTGIF